MTTVKPKSPVPSFRRGTYSALTMLAMGLPSLAISDAGFFIEPSLSVYILHDDNIFYTFSDEESSIITRYSPSLEFGYEKQTFNWNVVYRIDSEEYANNDDIDNGVIRRFADTTLKYQPTERLQFDADVRYTKTETLSDLSLVPGGTVQGPLQGRTNVNRLSVNPSISYRFTPTATGTLSYLRTEDRISDVLETNIRRAAVEIEHELDSKTAVSYGHFDREVEYDQEASPSASGENSSTESSRTTWLGLSRDITSSIVATIRGGGRRASGSTSPYWSMSVKKTYRAGDAQISFERNETTAPGTTDSQEFQTLNATITYQKGLNWVTSISPSYAKITQRSGKQKVYRIALTSTYKVNESWRVTGSYERNHQPIEFEGVSDESIDRNVLLAGITYVYPR